MFSLPSLPTLPRRRLLAVLLGWPLLLPLSTAALEMPPFVLARRYAPHIDPTPYWVSEKLDGVRALWDGERFVLRSGHTLPVPTWFSAGLPRGQMLDGELWLGRQRFNELSGLLRARALDDERWRSVRFVVFELPRGEGDFNARLQRIAALCEAAGVPWLVAHMHFRVTGRVELERRLAHVVADGGEGLMLHRADAPWQAGRSTDLLKMVPWHEDEATVVGYAPGRGRLEGLVGALLVKDEAGRRFRLGTGLSDDERRDPPPIGSRVTYRYRERTERGRPRFPRFVRRRDLP